MASRGRNMSSYN